MNEAMCPVQLSGGKVSKKVFGQWLVLFAGNLSPVYEIWLMSGWKNSSSEYR